MKLPEFKPSSNGKYEAPPHSSGAFAIQQPRTEFPQEQPQLSLATLFYNFSRYWLGGAPLLRWLIGTLLVGAVLGMLNYWWLTALCLVVLATLLITLHYLRRHDFVTFVAAPLPAIAAQSLNIKQKIPVFATGRFTVENKYQRYTWLPGFYRTFATRERALLCRVQEQRLLRITRWPETEIGLWYLFFMPDQVQQVRWGRLSFGSTARPAIAITYRLNKSKPKQADKIRREKIYEEKIFLAVQGEEDGYKILADLYRDVPASAFTPTAPTASTHQ